MVCEFARSVPGTHGGLAGKEAPLLVVGEHGQSAVVKMCTHEMAHGQREKRHRGSWRNVGQHSLC